MSKMLACRLIPARLAQIPRTSKCLLRQQFVRLASSKSYAQFNWQDPLDLNSLLTDEEKQISSGPNLSLLTTDKWRMTIPSNVCSLGS